MYPTNLPTYTDPVSTNPLNSPDLATQQSAQNADIIAVATKIGVDNSAVASTIDFLLKSSSSADPGHTHGTTSAPGGGAFWNTVPGTPTRVSDTQFTITDTGNANLYDLIFKKGVILKWLESTTFQTAMVISSSYATNTVTINIVGDSLTAGFTSMKYCIQMARIETFIIPGTLPSAATTDLAKSWYTPTGVYILSADLYVKTAGSGTGSTVIDINATNGTTKFTTKPTLTTTGASDLNNVADNPSTEVAEGVVITIDCDSITQTAAQIDAYIYLFYYDSSWRYRT